MKLKLWKLRRRLKDIKAYLEDENRNLENSIECCRMDLNRVARVLHAKLPGFTEGIKEETEKEKNASTHRQGPAEKGAGI